MNFTSWSSASIVSRDIEEHQPTVRTQATVVGGSDSKGDIRRMAGTNPTTHE
jgi:hypothetical protein